MSAADLPTAKCTALRAPANLWEVPLIQPADKHTSGGLLVMQPTLCNHASERRAALPNSGQMCAYNAFKPRSPSRGALPRGRARKFAAQHLEDKSYLSSEHALLFQTKRCASRRLQMRAAIATANFTANANNRRRRQRFSPSCIANNAILALSSFLPAAHGAPN